MSKLYVAQGACSFASHVIVKELHLPIEIVLVSLTDIQSPHRQLSKIGRIPILQLDDGTVITENSAILPFLADLSPGTSLFAAPYTVERAQIQSWIGYLSSEIHAGILRIINRPERFHDNKSEYNHIRKKGYDLLLAALEPISTQLREHPWLVGDRFTIADAYLGVFLGWLHARLDLSTIDSNLAKYYLAYTNRPSVQKAQSAEAAK